LSVLVCTSCDIGQSPRCLELGTGILRGQAVDENGQDSQVNQRIDGRIIATKNRADLKNHEIRLIEEHRRWGTKLAVCSMFRSFEFISIPMRESLSE
ncbi:hypothetical protein PFISCL1PPCAC_8146, partial [Pristionchus fissidentatus]